MTATVPDLERLATVLAERSPRFRFATVAPMGACSLASLGDPVIAGALVDDHARARGLDLVRWTRDDAATGTATMLTVHGIASRVLCVVLAGVVLERRLVLVRRDDVHIAPRRRSFALAVTGGEVEEVDDVVDAVDRAVEHWVDGHLSLLVDDIRRARRVPRSVLRGHVAEAALAALALLDWWQPDAEVVQLATRLRTSPTSLLAASSRASVRFDGRRDGLEAGGEHAASAAPRSSERTHHRAAADGSARHIRLVHGGVGDAHVAMPMDGRDDAAG